MNKIFENQEFLVIDKPAGLLVHGADHIDEPTLTDKLLAEYPEIAKVGEDPARPGIVHRLDKLASGLMAIPKTPASFDNLKKQFQDRTVIKKYIALAYGQVEKDEGEINFPIERSAKGHKMAALPLTIKGDNNLSGRRAVTQFDVIKRFVNYTLLDLHIITGRTHQIRVHLAAYGCPLVGDDLYGTHKTKIKNAKLGLGRIFLHAYELSFTDLAGQLQKFKISLPKDLQIFIDKLN